MADYYIGEIRMFAGLRVPSGWVRCDGATIPVAGNEALFALIGTTYGGDGRTNFALPNLSGRVPLGAGQGPNLSPHPLGQAIGTEGVALTTAMMPTHTHTLQASTGPGTSRTPGPTLAFATIPSPFVAYTNPPAGATTTDDDFATVAISVSGSSASHSNLMPVIGVDYIIALRGVFPSD
ncbi:phage tail protein [Roseixanthobacter glucoisosaccharinicivorans]|uniref:phage tail protein n=1 Tax=Roseixanthobacter glucoisosaccharinicivorans TaxID=3119923 RepID=UPI003729F591